MAIKNESTVFTFDYSKYDTGLSNDQIRDLIQGAVAVNDITSGVIFALKCIAIAELCRQLKNNIDVEKEAARQDWQGQVSGNAGINVGV